MSTLRVLALDPGGTTGWFTYTAEVLPALDTPYRTHHDVKWASGHLGREEHHYQLYALLEMQAVQEFYIVCESFEFRNRARPGLDLSSKEYIGVVKTFIQERAKEPNAPVLVMQTAAVGKAFGSDKKLEKLGIQVCPPSRWPHMHINDAGRHLVRFLCTQLSDEVPHLLNQLRP